VVSNRLLSNIPENQISSRPDGRGRKRKKVVLGLTTHLTKASRPCIWGGGGGMTMASRALRIQKSLRDKEKGGGGKRKKSCPSPQ